MSNVTSSDSDLSSFISSLPYTYDVSNKSTDIISNYNKYEGKNISMAGRVIAIRKAGKLLFVDILDQHGKMQCYFDYNKIGEELFKSAKGLNSGDIIGVEGIIFHAPTDLLLDPNISFYIWIPRPQDPSIYMWNRIIKCIFRIE